MSEKVYVLGAIISVFSANMAYMVRRRKCFGGHGQISFQKGNILLLLQDFCG